MVMMMMVFADINECSTTHICNTEISDCVNTEGNYRCECKTGYTQSATSDKVCTGENCLSLIRVLLICLYLYLHLYLYL